MIVVFYSFLFWCFYLATSYSLARKRTEAYALSCRAHSLSNDALKNLKVDSGDEDHQFAEAYRLWLKIGDPKTCSNMISHIFLFLATGNDRGVEDVI
ncbi:hypothetical protein LOK49_LG01G03036 [Camellia lanceoleosa]|uniref:Uncharacterized protein n=1 Tax=Camellia lanceoleosa TaxID=1840588 RepID=A0ACC0IWZ0_9ERIC|nr:hypothetical protein LOK49_LG01G03036 [Camellia lanceoleosa]